MIARFRLPSVAPSSPASRPSPPGGLAASLDPGCGRHPPTAAGTGPEKRTPRPRSANLRSPHFRGIPVWEVEGAGVRSIAVAVGRGDQGAEVVEGAVLGDPHGARACAQL